MNLPVVPTTHLTKIVAPSVDLFLTRHLVPRIPVIIEDDRPFKHALQFWSLKYFSELHGNQVVYVKRLDKRYKVKMAEYLNYVASIRADINIDDPPFYLANIVLAKAFPDRTSDFDVPPYFLPNWLERRPLKFRFPIAAKSSTEVFIGPPGARLSNLHRDKFATHSWLSQITGKKRVWLISPSDTNCIYQLPNDPDLSAVENPDRASILRFPLLAGATVLTGVLGPGEALFIPSGWWHAAESITASISLSGNFVNGSNYSDFQKSLMATSGLRGSLPAFASHGLLSVHYVSCKLNDLFSRPAS